MLSREFEFEPMAAAYPGEVASRYRHTDNGCEFGVITSISAPFCRQCSRARLSADGRLFTCLFASEGFDLAGAMRAGDLDDEALHRLVSDLWRRRDDRYSEIRSTSGSAQKVEMSFIGG
jgi:cyclic pyranopterin phosphate synthase